MEEKILYFFEQFWTFVAVSVGIAIAGVAVKRVVALVVPVEREIARAEEAPKVRSKKPSAAERKQAEVEGNGPYRTKGRLSVADLATDSALPLWYRVWRATISAHPLIVGALVGLAPIPAAQWVPPAAASRMLWFALAGALSGQVFEVLNRLREIVIAVARQKLGGGSEPAATEDEFPAIADELEPEEKEDRIP